MNKLSSIVGAFNQPDECESIFVYGGWLLSESGRIVDGQITDFFGKSQITSGRVSNMNVEFRKAYVRANREYQYSFTNKAPRDGRVYTGEYKAVDGSSMTGQATLILTDIGNVGEVIGSSWSANLNPQDWETFLKQLADEGLLK